MAPSALDTRPSKTEENSLSFGNRVRAMLYGAAYGDALGATVEKLTAAQIRERYGRVESIHQAWWRMEQSETMRKGRIRGNGIFTDDTLMMLCLLQVYREQGRHLDAWDLAEGMIRQVAWTPRWIPEMQRETMLLERLFYAEKWLFQRHQLSACDPRQGGIGNMVNCGAAMYIAPIGAVNAGNPKAAYDEAIAFGLGHQESYGLEAAAVLAAAVAAAFVPDTTIDIVVAKALELAKDGTKAALTDIVEAVPALKGKPHAQVTEAFHNILAKYSYTGDDIDYSIAKAGKATKAWQPSRFNAIEELPMALGFALVNDGDFAKSVADGINSGRDTDSIGVMTGAVLGALKGSAVIDANICNQINKVNRVDLLANADSFTQTALQIQAADRKAMEAVFAARERL
jgi:ADP-ribosylglycohydrolase